ncbi:MAG TPA: ABC transporter permease [Candidatus Acidoferrales bacterium]|nr:ABC transporter permease [Candidatus Acidoferrales bacterium]
MPSDKPSFSERFFKSLLRVFPFDFQTNYGGEMAGVFHDQRQEAAERGRPFDFLRLWAETIAGIFRTAPREHWEILKQDFAYSLRMMRKNWGFSLLAIFTLALGIGANTAIFSVVHAVLLEPLPYAHGRQLVFIREQALKEGNEDISFSVPEILDYRQQNHTLASLVEYHGMSFTLFGHGDPDRVRTGVVSWNYFDAFGVRPIMGRAFRPADDAIGAPAVLILSYEYWRNRFHSDPDIVEKTFEMNDKVHTIIGVLPPIPQYPNEKDVYMPTSACPFRSSKMMIENRDHRMMEVFGEMKPGVTLAAARADLSAIAGRLEAEYPKYYPPDAGYAVATTSLRGELTKDAQPTLLVLLAAAGFVLLIACANVANLTLSRMARRERELAVRTALGAGRTRLLRQLLTESFLLAIIGGGFGLLLAYDSLGLLADFAARLTPRAREIHVDAGVLIFTLVIALGTSIVFGTLSAISSRSNLTSGLKEGTAGSGAGQRHNFLRSALIVAQVAFSFVLLIGAGLMLRSLYNMLQVNPGFVPQHVLAMKTNFNWSKYKMGNDLSVAAQKIIDRAKAEPGVLSAAMSSSYPLEPELVSAGPSGFMNDFQIEGRDLRPGQAPPASNITAASPEYFQTLGIPLVEGREFQDTDDSKTMLVTIINETARRLLWPNEDPVGKHISFDHGEHWSTIVGVVGDVREFGLDRPAAPEIYMPVAQNSSPGTLLIRTAMDPVHMADRMRAIIREVDADTAVTRIRTIEQARSESLAAPRVTASLLGLFAALALLIAVAGIGGIMALSVSQRVREIGIRMALGAQPAGILRMVIGQGLLLAVIGVGAGFLGALGVTRLVKSLLFEVAPTDPLTFAGVALVLVLAAAIACYIPARRAASVDPIFALRSE